MECHKCIHKGINPGTAHIKCVHPLVREHTEDPMSAMMAIFASVGRVAPQVSEISIEMGVVLHDAGVRNGWANWPWSYDPVWVTHCDKFEEAE